MSQELKSQFKDLKKISHFVRPDQNWVASNKQKLFQQIHNSTAYEAPKTSVANFVEFWFPKQKMLVPIRVFSVMLVFIGATAGSWIAGVSASDSSLPGEVLYNVKIATENTQLAVASAFSAKENKAENKAKLQLEFAGRRSKEVKELVAKKTVDSTNLVPQTIQKLKDTMQEAQNNLKEAKGVHPQNAIVLAQVVTETTSNIVENLKSVSKSGTSANAQTVKDAVETSKIMNETGIQVIQGVLADKNVTDSATQAQLKQLAEQKIETIVKKIEENKVAVEAAKFEVKFNDMYVPTPLEVSTSSEKSTLLAKQAEKVDENIKKADQVANEVKELLADNKVDAALEKAKTLNTLTSETQQAIADTQPIPTPDQPAAPVTSSSTVQ